MKQTNTARTLAHMLLRPKRIEKQVKNDTMQAMAEPSGQTERLRRLPNQNQRQMKVAAVKEKMTTFLTRINTIAALELSMNLGLRIDVLEVNYYVYVKAMRIRRPRSLFFVRIDRYELEYQLFWSKLKRIKWQ